jgi:hypothetical protein
MPDLHGPPAPPAQQHPQSACRSPHHSRPRYAAHKQGKAAHHRHNTAQQRTAPEHRTQDICMQQRSWMHVTLWTQVCTHTSGAIVSHTLTHTARHPAVHMAPGDRATACCQHQLLLAQRARALHVTVACHCLPTPAATPAVGMVHGSRRSTSKNTCESSLAARQVTHHSTDTLRHAGRLFTTLPHLPVHTLLMMTNSWHTSPAAGPLVSRVTPPHQQPPRGTCLPPRCANHAALVEVQGHSSSHSRHWGRQGAAARGLVWEEVGREPHPAMTRGVCGWRSGRKDLPARPTHTHTLLCAPTGINTQGRVPTPCCLYTHARLQRQGLATCLPPVCPVRPSPPAAPPMVIWSYHPPPHGCPTNPDDCSKSRQCVCSSSFKSAAMQAMHEGVVSQPSQHGSV